MKNKLLIKLIYLTIIGILSINAQAQKNQNNYLDKIDFWKQESFNKKIKEVITERNEYFDDYSRDKQPKKLKTQTISKLVFSKSGKLMTQLEQKSSFLSSKKHKNNKKISYEYDAKLLLKKERTYTNLDSLTLEPTDTSQYSLKIYHYDSKGILNECLEYNNSKILILKTIVSVDTLKNKLEISKKGNNHSFNQTKAVYHFDMNSNLIEITYYNGSQIKGKYTFVYDTFGKKKEEKYKAFDSHFESMERFKYNKFGHIEEVSRNSNIDPCDKTFYTYTFDKNKNWLTKDIKNDTGIVVKAYIRKIVYYK
jgi:hypothetical protein